MLGKLSCYVTKVSILLFTVALIVEVTGCGPTQYNLTMAVAPGGSGTAADLTNASPYAAGTVISITAVAAADYQFVHWTVPAGTFGNATAGNTTFTMPAQDVTVTATFAEKFVGGSGTEEDPYQIADWYQLDNIRNYLDSYFVLVNDLDATTAGYEGLASPTANQGAGWPPIGTDDDPFTGTFDGQGFEISDLFIYRPDEYQVGLFGAVGEGVIKDTGVVNITVIGDGYFAGGLVGVNEGTVSNSYASGSVTGYEYVGGLLGENDGFVMYSYFTGSVTGNDYVGGLLGKNDGTVSKSYFTGSITSEGWYAGGLVGHNGGNVTNCYSTGNVTGDEYVGGLMGYNYYVTVSSSYSTGNVSGNDYVGGLVGYNDGGTVSNSFWDTQTSGQATSDGGTGKTTLQMKSTATFSGAGWNIIAVALNETNPSYIWNIVDNVTYPFLSWQP
jgi:hypothetical protein